MKIIRSTCIFLLGLMSIILGHAQLENILYSNVLVPGESVQYFVIQTEGREIVPKELPTVKNGRIELKQAGSLRTTNSRTGRYYILAFECIPDSEGVMSIPSFPLYEKNGTKEFKTEALDIPVLPFSKIEWKEIRQGNTTIPYGVLWYINPDKPYVNQSISATLKLYTNEEIQNLQIPDLQSEGIAMSRFVPPIPFGSITPSGTALLKGKEWNAYSYPGKISPLRAGKVTLGPGILSGTSATSQVNPRFGQFIQSLVTTTIDLPAISFEAQALPKGAPAGYQNAVGKFTLTTATNAIDITEGEPISVTITISGSGNLNIIECPKPINQDQWKLYPANKTKGNEENSTTVEYQLLMRATEKVTEVPAFELIYFNPETKQYETARSAPIPLEWKNQTLPAGMHITTAPTTPPPAGIIPVEEMTDILVAPSYSASLGHTFWGKIIANTQKQSIALLGFLALLPALIIILIGIFIRYKAYLDSQKVNTERLKALNELTNPKDSTKEFLKKMGNFIEANIPLNARTPDVTAILTKRDSLSYIPEDKGETIPPAEQSAMLKAIRQVLKTLPILFLTLLASLNIINLQGQEKDPATTPPAITQSQATTAPQTSLTTTEKESQPLPSNATAEETAFHYYTLGNEAYRKNEIGIAALNYRRALLTIPNFHEAQRNLDFIERKEGAIVPIVGSANEVLAWFTPATWLTFSNFALGLFLFCGAVIWAFRKFHSKLWISLTLISALAFLLTTLGYVNQPKTSHTLRPSTQYVITQKETKAWHDASKDSKAVLASVPVGTLAEVIAERGPWLYVQFMNDVRGWIQKDKGQFVMPHHE